MSQAALKVRALTGAALAEAGRKAKTHISEAEHHHDKTEEQYKLAGKYLTEAKQSLKHGEWEPWLGKYKISSQTASRCIRIYAGTLTMKEQRASTRNDVAKYRAAKPPLRKGDLPRFIPLPHEPIQEEDYDDDTQEKRWQRSCMNCLGEILAMEAFWVRQFGPEWHKFEVPSHIMKLIEEAEVAWKKLIRTLKK